MMINCPPGFPEGQGDRQKNEFYRTPANVYVRLNLGNLFLGKTASKTPHQVHDLVIEKPSDLETLVQIPRDLHDTNMEVFGRVNP